MNRITNRIERCYLDVPNGNRLQPVHYFVRGMHDDCNNLIFNANSSLHNLKIVRRKKEVSKVVHTYVLVHREYVVVVDLVPSIPVRISMPYCDHAKNEENQITSTTDRKYVI